MVGTKRGVSNSMSSREYLDRDGVLVQLGFNSYLGYLRSPIWDLIRREILFRDECCCRNPECPFGGNGPKQAHHLAYSLPTLLGINPSCIVTLCKGCHEWVEFDGKEKRPPAAVRKLTFYLVTRLTMVPGRTDRRIGDWFRQEWIRNEFTARRIYKRMKEELPDWHRVIHLNLKARTVSKLFIPYLGLREIKK